MAILSDVQTAEFRQTASPTIAPDRDFGHDFGHGTPYTVHLLTGEVGMGGPSVWQVLVVFVGIFVFILLLNEN